MDLKYNTINKNINKMSKTKTINNKYNNKTTENNKHKIINLSNIKLTKSETEVLSLGYKYKFPYNNVSNIKQNMVAETQVALNILDIADKEGFKYESAKIINKITSKKHSKANKRRTAGN